MNPDRYKDITKAEAKAHELNEKWLNSPKEELGGKTPKGAILEERKKLGNPSKAVRFAVSITKLEPGKEIMQEAEKFFYEGVEKMNAQKPKDSLKAYRQ